MPQVILIGTGSEVEICLQACETLRQEGIRAARGEHAVWELFQQQSPTYQQEVLPAEVRARVAVEAGAELGWREYLGSDGRFVGMQGFGASGTSTQLYAHFGITPQAVATQAKAALQG